MKCANCENDALYEYKITVKASVFYCGKHLPKFLYGRKQASLIPLTDAHASAKQEALETLVTQPPVADESVEEPVVEEEAIEKPKKKATKNKAE